MICSSPRTKTTEVEFLMRGINSVIQAVKSCATLFEALKKLALEAFLFLLLVRELLRLLKQ